MCSVLRVYTPPNGMFGTAYSLSLAAVHSRRMNKERLKMSHWSKLYHLEHQQGNFQNEGFCSKKIAGLWYWGYKMFVGALSPKWWVYSIVGRGRNYAMAGVLLKTQGGQAISPFRKGQFWMGTTVVLVNSWFEVEGVDEGANVGVERCFLYLA